MVKRPFSLLVPSYYSLTIETVVNSDRVLVYVPLPPLTTFRIAFNINYRHYKRFVDNCFFHIFAVGNY